MGLHSPVRGTTENSFSVGDGTSSNKAIEANIPGANKPAFRFNSTSGKWEMSHDGITFGELVDLITLMNSIGVSLSFWLQGSNVLGNTYALNAVARTEAISSSPQTLSTIYYKSSVANTPAPFVIKSGQIILVHFQAKVSTVEAPAKTCSVKTQLFYVDADGTSNPVQIGSDSSSTIPLTTSQVTFNLTVDVASEVSVPAGKRLWLKFIVTRTSAEYAPTISIWDGDVHDHIVIPVAGSILGRFLQLAGGTMTGTLEVPAVKITTGAGVDRVLVSDADGDATWQDISTNPSVPTDHSASGHPVLMVAGENLVFGDLCYLKSDGKWWKVDASAEITMPCAAMAIATISADAAGLFALPNSFIRDDTWNWTVGGTLYASETAGAMTHTAPATVGAQVQSIGSAYTADIVYFRPALIVIEIGADGDTLFELDGNGDIQPVA
jgi:hypothetical protein